MECLSHIILQNRQLFGMRDGALSAMILLHTFENSLFCRMIVSLWYVLNMKVHNSAETDGNHIFLNVANVIILWLHVNMEGFHGREARYTGFFSLIVQFSSNISDPRISECALHFFRP